MMSIFFSPIFHIPCNEKRFYFDLFGFIGVKFPKGFCRSRSQDQDASDIPEDDVPVLQPK